MKNDESHFEVRPKDFGAFSSFPLEGLEIQSPLKGIEGKQLVGAVKVETKCNSLEETNLTEQEQN